MIPGMTYEQRLRRQLVRGLRRNGFLRDDTVAEALSTVPRHVFVPDRPLKAVYRDEALITKQLDGVPVSSSSQPSIMAIMLEQLQLEPGQHVLEIGAGTGYNAALIARLVGAKGRVTTVDIDPEIAARAKANIRSADFNNVHVVTGDGGAAFADDAPYDRIIATASCWQVPPRWVEQLKDGGLLVLPFRLNGAHISLALRKQGGDLISTGASTCGFMPLRGAFGPSYERRHDDATASADGDLSMAAWMSLERLLREPRDVKVSFPRRRDFANTPLFYIALQGKPVLRYFRQTGSSGTVPFLLLTSPKSAIGLPALRPPRGRLALFGSDEALTYMRRALADWHEAGQPDQRQLRARVRPSRARLGPLPRPANGKYRFRRGDHLYELWFER